MSAHVDPIPREARPFQGHRAGLVTRTVAAAIDIAIVTVALGVSYLGIWLFLLLFNPRISTPPTPSPWLVSGVGCLLLTLYLAVNWMGGGGRTYGDHVMGLRVVNREGRRLGPFLALVRAAFCVIFPIGLLWVLFSGQNRSLQDLVLRTSVIYDWDVRPLQAPPAPTRA
jgi:uncharacterized RDD family membrane protein YckC